MVQAALIAPTKNMYTMPIAMSVYTAGKIFTVQDVLIVPTKNISMDMVMASVFGAGKNFTAQDVRTVLRNFTKNKK